MCPCVFAKDATSGTKAHGEGQMFLMRENMAREGGMIQLVSGEVNVLHAYIIQGGSVN